jgi:hypothetical protein
MLKQANYVYGDPILIIHQTSETPWLEYQTPTEPHARETSIITIKEKVLDGFKFI